MAPLSLEGPSRLTAKNPFTNSLFLKQTMSAITDGGPAAPGHFGPLCDTQPE